MSKFGFFNSSKNLCENIVQSSFYKLQKFQLNVLLTDEPDEQAYARSISNVANKNGVKVAFLSVKNVHDVNAYISEALITSNNGTPTKILLTHDFHEQTLFNASNVDTSNIDIDGFSIQNIGKLFEVKNHNADLYKHVPCTADAIFRLLYQNIDAKNNGLNKIQGKKILIINRTNTIGLPLMKMLLLNNGVPTITHSKGAKLTKSYLGQFNVIITATGRKIIDNSNYNENIPIIDAGVHFENGKLCGDVDIENIDHISNYTSPRAIGKLTTYILLSKLFWSMYISNKICYNNSVS